MSFWVNGSLVVKSGGAIKIGDVTLTRGAADRLHIGDAVQITGTANVTGATRLGGALTAAGGIATGPGTPFCLPYGTAVPTFAVNGDLRFYHKSTDHIPRLAFQSNGTVYTIALPTATHGTISVTVAATAP